MARSLNKAELIGNLTKDAELRFTPQGTAVCSFTVATNRKWTDSAGQQKDEATFHRIVAWSKLAEICGQYLHKGSKVYVAGRIANRRWEDQQGITRNVSEIVISDMLMLDSKRGDVAAPQGAPPEPAPSEPEPSKPTSPAKGKSKEEIDVEDIPENLGDEKK